MNHTSTTRSHKEKRPVISTEATHSFIVRRAVERPPNFVIACSASLSSLRVLQALRRSLFLKPFIVAC